MKKINTTLLKKLPLALALAAATVSSAQATEFNFGDTKIRWDNSVSYGVAWRTEGPDKNNVFKENGEALGIQGNSSSYNYDDGTLNYKENSIYTNVFKYGTDLEITRSNYGAFIRARAFYDTEINDGKREFKELNDETKDAAGMGWDILDAYVFTDFDLGDMPTTLRLGRQVVSWGESTFIQGGINSINPVDASAFRRPGAEVKDLLLPVNMIFTSIGVTADLSIEAFYQLEWEKTRIDPCGTFFSNADFVADGCGPVILGGVADERDLIEQRDLEVLIGDSLSTRVSPITERIADDEPKDGGQYGISARYYIGDIELGIYYMNIHSRLPFINGIVTNQDANGFLGGGVNLEVNPNAEYNSKYPLYQISYPEDQQLMGLSFATTSESGISIGGEVSYRPDAPIQWNAFELILGGNGVPWSRLYQQRKAEAEAKGLGAEDLYGSLAKGYDEFDVWQAQVTFIQFYDRVLGGDRFIIAAEFGATYVPGLPDLDDARYGRSGTYGIGDNAGVSHLDETGEIEYCEVGGTTANVSPEYCNDEGFVSKLSGGVRLRSGINYNNAFAGLNATPFLGFGYDIGNGPEPGTQFIDERLTYNIGMQLVYQSRITATINYTSYNGGDYNDRKDRDNIALAANYSF